MRTITAVTWDSLIDRNPTRDSSKPPSTPAATLPPPTYYISPSLYAATDTSSIPDSSPNSPYVLNHKRRDLPSTPSPAAAATVVVDVPPAPAEVEEGGVGDGCDDHKSLEGEADEGVGDNTDADDFYDPRETMSVSSSSGEGEAGCSVRRCPSWGRMSLSNQSEFYDAATDFSDGSVSHSSPSFGTNNEIELQALQLNLLEQIGKRKRVEEALQYMQDQWQRMAKFLSQLGFSSLDIQHSGNMTDPIALCQEIVITKFVMEAVERGIARAESEAVLEEVIESKNHEISRLRDRLQYYDAMNHEMSQRNQEVVEAARQQRLRRKTRRRWIWSCVGLSVTLGAGFLAYSHSSHSSTSSDDAASVTTDSKGSKVNMTD